MLIIDIELGSLELILGILLDLLNLFKGDVFVVCNEFVLDIDYEEELLYFKVLEIYFVVIWFLDERLFKVFFLLLI